MELSVLSYLPLLHTRVDTDVHRYGNLIHLYISAEMCLTLLVLATVPIKPNYTILLFLLSNEEDLLGVGGDVT